MRAARPVTIAPKKTAYWADTKNQKELFDSIAQKLQISTLDDWYKVKASQVQKYGGKGLLKHYYGESLIKALSQVYPEHKWVEWRFEKVPQGYWNNIENQRKFFDWLASQWNVTRPEDWYRIKTSDVQHAGGHGLLYHHYRNSLHKALCSIYPDYPWKPWLFAQVPKLYWNNPANVMEYLKWIQDQWGITTLHDWYSLSREQISSGETLLKKYGGLIPLLEAFYPDFKWNRNQAKSTSKGQTLLTKFLKELFVGEPMKMNYRHPGMFFRQTNHDMEFDIFIPSLSLAFEYQGQHHYNWYYLRGSPEAQQQRDQEKREACAQRNITLIEIPYWWDRSKHSLIGTILKYKPELIKSFKVEGTVKPIPDEFPGAMKQYTRASRIFGIELPMPAPWISTQDPTGWWVSKKVQGVRCFWDGKQLLFRNGTKINAPPEFISQAGFPEFPLDGVLHTEDHHFLKAAITTKYRTDINSWKNMKVMALDSPSQSNSIYEDRLSFLRHNVKPSQHLYVVDVIQCQGPSHLQEMSQHSIILRKPSSKYFSAGSLFKKELFERQEAQITNIETSSSATILHCLLPNGLKFSLPLNSSDLQSNLPEELASHNLTSLMASNSLIGKVVTTKYHSTDSSGLPVSPSLDSIRPDLVWEDVVNRFGIAYKLTLGNKKGGFPKCRSCLQPIADRNQPRIEVRGVFAPPESTPFPVKYSICLKNGSKCLTQAIQKFSKSSSSGIYFPPFDKKISVSPTVKDQVDLPSLLVDAEDIQFVVV